MLSFDRKKQNSEKQLSFNKEIFFFKREHIWLSSDEVDGPRTYFTEWSELERER